MKHLVENSAGKGVFVKNAQIKQKKINKYKK